jgi:hypothetical protein
MRRQYTFRVAVTYYVGSDKRRKVARVRTSSESRAIDALKNKIRVDNMNQRVTFEPEDIECDII